ncbi:MAG: phosphoadenosine phosphosulfate reductase family protein [Thermodesulfovibrionia bacterium]|nr:phosphoadenosine phosphosulfate reductase family protein [Thermodesulfovibrionia bacterium]
MYNIRNKIKNSINDRKSVFLFTGDKASTLLMSIVNDMDMNIVFIDTGFHFNEIMDYVKTSAADINIIRNINALADPAIDMSECCSQRKGGALKEYLEMAKAECLIVPFRDEERGNGIEDSYLKRIDNIEIIRPLAELTESDVWLRIKESKLQFSSIYNKGYSVVDCKCCTARHGRKRQGEELKTDVMDKETEEKLKALGYM